MSRRIPSPRYGKAFLWLLAIALALLVEGFLSQQFGGIERASTVEIEPDTTEAPSANSVRVDQLAAGIIELAQLFRTVR